MTVSLAVATRNARCDAITAKVDAGSGAGYMEIRSGTKPTNADAAATGTVLATVPLPKPSAAAASGGVLTMNVTGATATASAAGTASWARVYDSTGNTVWDGTVGTSASDITIGSTTITVGETVTITAGTLTEPA